MKHSFAAMGLAATVIVATSTTARSPFEELRKPSFKATICNNEAKRKVGSFHFVEKKEEKGFVAGLKSMYRGLTTGKTAWDDRNDEYRNQRQEWIAKLRKPFQECMDRPGEPPELPQPTIPQFHGDWKKLTPQQASEQRAWFRARRSPVEVLQDEIDDLESRIEALEFESRQ